MAANVEHLGHSASMDFVGFLLVVPYIGLHRMIHQTIGNAFPTR